MKTPKLIKATPQGGATLAVEYADGLTATLNLSRHLRGEFSQPLRDPAVFRRVKIKDGLLTWPNGFDICPDMLRYWTEQGRVTSKKETDAHFEQAWAVADFQVA